MTAVLVLIVSAFGAVFFFALYFLVALANFRRAKRGL